METSTRFVTEQARSLPAELVIGLELEPSETLRRGERTGSYKRRTDVVIAALMLPVFALFALGLIVANPFFNPGPLLYRQERMGYRRRRFTMIKFRSMTAHGAPRGPEDRLEADRITRLGRWLRISRMDELPQILNVLRGEMSMVGPRPDCWSHALYFCETVPGYAGRYTVRPGITGLAQVSSGYAEGTEATYAKVRQDLIYIRRIGPLADLTLLWRTVFVVLRGTGAR